MSANGTADLVWLHLLLVNLFFKDNINGFDSDDGCRDFAKSLLNDFTFPLGSIKEMKKICVMAPLSFKVLQLINYIDGVVTIFGLEKPGNAFIGLVLLEKRQRQLNSTK